MANINTFENVAVRFALRIRPLTAEELVTLPAPLQKNVLSTTPFTPNQVTVQGERKQSYMFDHVFGPEISQKEIYDRAVMNLVDKFLDGFNATIIAYGHASSGKTHTLGLSYDVSPSNESKGIIPRSMSTLFSCINSAQYKARKFVMRISFVEIHNNTLIDLLGDKDSQTFVREDSSNRLFWKNLKEIKVNNVDEIMGILSSGALSQNSSTLNTNASSWRGHRVFTVTLSQQKFVPSNGIPTNSNNVPPTTSKFNFGKSKSREEIKTNKHDGEWIAVTSKFHFVDLAWNDMKNDNILVNPQEKECHSLNSAILPLGNVISTQGMASDKEYKHTRTLKDYIGNNTQTLVISCVSPAINQIKETINTLEYATQARNLKNTFIVHHEVGWHNLEHLQDLVLKLRTEVRALRASVRTDSDTPNSDLTSSSHDLQLIEKQDSQNSQITKDLNDDHKDIDELEEKFSHLQRSYAEISQDLPINNIINSDLSKENLATINLLAKHLESFKDDDESSFIQRILPSFQKALGPVIQEYEKSITSLENQLLIVRTALNHSESMMHLQEDKLQEAEELNNQNRSMINDLKGKISRLTEREETTESYIKNLEAKLDSEAMVKKKDQEIINELKNQISKLNANDGNIENRIDSIEIQLEYNEDQVAAASQTTKNLEKALCEKDEAYVNLKKRLEKQHIINDEEKKWLIGEIEMRDHRISQLEKKIDDLVNEIARLKQSHVDANYHSHSSHHSRSSSLTSVDNISLIDQPKLETIMQIKDFPSVSQLESKLCDLQKIHNETMCELEDIKNKYQTCLKELNNLHTQVDEAKKCKQSPSMTSSNDSDVAPTITSENLREDIDYSPRHHVNYHKARSKSAEIQGSKKHDLTNAAIIQNLQIELRQLEVLHADKARGLDTMKQEFARLEINYRETLEIVEELREEIKHRDALGQQESVSAVISEYTQTDGYYLMAVTGQTNQQELIQKLKEEIEHLEEEQKVALKTLAEHKKNYNIDAVTRIQTSIVELKADIHRILECDQDSDKSRVDTVNRLQSRLKELEEQLIKEQETIGRSQVNEGVETPFDALQQTEQANVILMLQQQVSKLQNEIEVKGHVIAVLKSPSMDQQHIIERLEDELHYLKEVQRLAIEAKNKLSVMPETEETKIGDEIVSDCLEQSSDVYIKTLEEKVGSLEAQLEMTKEMQVKSYIDSSQRAVDILQEKLTALQQKLDEKSETIETLRVEQDIATILQEQLDNLKNDIQKKSDVIETLKKDLVDNNILEQKLFQKEAQTLNLKKKLSQMQRQEESLQKEMSELKRRLSNLTSGDDVNKVLQIELDSLRKELQDVREREFIALERLQLLKSRIDGDSEESQLQEQLDYLQSVEVMQRNRITVLENKILEKGERVDEFLFQLRTDLALAKESKVLHIRTIEALEIKLQNLEDRTLASTLQLEMAEMRFKESQQLEKIRNLELNLSRQTANDIHHIKCMLEEIKNIHSHEWKQTKDIELTETSLELIKSESDVSLLKDEITNLKNSKVTLNKTIQDLKFKLVESQEQLSNLEILKAEIINLKKLENEQKYTIEQLQLQLSEIKDSRELSKNELELMKKGINHQNEVIESLEKEVINLRQELFTAKEINLSSTQELEKLSEKLNTTQKQYDNEQKRVKALEIEIETYKLAGTNTDKNVIALREALANTKLEMVAQNEILAELETEMMAIEKKRDHHIEIGEKLATKLQEQEFIHKETVTGLESKLSNLETKLAKAQDSSFQSKKIITNLEQTLVKVQSQLDDAQLSEVKHTQFITELQDKLIETNTILMEREKQLTTQDYQIAELEAVLHKTQIELEKTKVSEHEAEERVKQVEAKLSEIAFRLGSSHSIEEFEAAKKMAEEQSILVKELEEILEQIQNQTCADAEISNANIAKISAELEEARAAEKAKAALVKDLEKTLKAKNDNVLELERALMNSKEELEKIKDSESIHMEMVASLEIKLQEVETQREEGIHKLKEANEEITLMQKQYMELQKQVEDSQSQLEMQREQKNLDDLLSNQLKEAQSQANEHLKQIGQLEEKIQQLEIEKKQESELYTNATDELAQLKKEFESLAEEFADAASKFENADELSKQQKIRIENLESVLDEAKKLQRITPTLKLNGSTEITEISDTNSMINSLTNTKDELMTRIVELEARACSLNDQNKNLQNELSCFTANDMQVFEDMKQKITEFEAVKKELKELEEINETFFEECKVLEAKVQSLMKQLWSLTNGGNEATLQVAELNDQIIKREKEISELKIKSSSEMKEEISRLLNENESLKKAMQKINQESIDANNVELQELHRNQGQLTISSLLASSNLTNAPPPTPPPNHPLPPVPIILPQTPNSPISRSTTPIIARPRTPLSPKPEHIHSESICANSDLVIEIQRLNKRIAKIEGENLQNQQLVETLESTLNENETNLNLAKQELAIIQSQKMDLIRQVKSLKSQLDEAKDEIESTKYEVKNEKQVMEKVLEEERQAKEKSERARIALENQMEKLMAKRSKFMCF
ncbi:221_t:CDS:2 [Gigaspora margarita]|uniref:221_t:CDS:1 n=1 Tax=Gigaspora margarita TaxID=4874 RepID=A0ABN7UBV7_GIGMA|nr:221_t:CDS:2 [Gigaspora margarita]